MDYGSLWAMAPVPTRERRKAMGCDRLWPMTGMSYHGFDCTIIFGIRGRVMTSVTRKSLKRRTVLLKADVVVEKRASY